MGVAGKGGRQLRDQITCKSMSDVWSTPKVQVSNKQAIEWTSGKQEGKHSKQAVRMTLGNLQSVQWIDLKNTATVQSEDILSCRLAYILHQCLCYD